MSAEISAWYKGGHALQSSQGVLELRQWRASVLIRVRPSIPVFEGLIDTGAPISVFPQKVWASCEGDIEWLSDESDERLPEWLRFVGGLAGGTIPCRIGRLTITIYGKQMTRIFENVAVTGKMILDQGRLPPKILLGLFGQPLESGFRWTGGEHPQAWIDQPIKLTNQ